MFDYSVQKTYSTRNFIQHKCRHFTDKAAVAPPSIHRMSLKMARATAQRAKVPGQHNSRRDKT